jgi:aspartate/methionine/tyrosine aminotransferase
VSRWTDDSLGWSARLLAETGVAVAPGIDFDPVDGGRYIRLSFAGETVEIATAVELLGEWLSEV